MGDEFVCEKVAIAPDLYIPFTIIRQKDLIFGNLYDIIL